MSALASNVPLALFVLLEAAAIYTPSTHLVNRPQSPIVVCSNFKHSAVTRIMIIQTSRALENTPGIDLRNSDIACLPFANSGLRE
jgi:hypothetical protein